MPTIDRKVKVLGVVMPRRIQGKHGTMVQFVWAKQKNVDCDDKDFPMPGLDNQMTRSYPCWAPVHKNQREINDPTLLWDKIFQPIPSHLLAKSDPRKYGENWIGSAVQSVSWIFVRSTIVTCLIFSIPFAIRGRGHHVCLASQLS